MTHTEGPYEQWGSTIVSPGNGFICWMLEPRPDDGTTQQQISIGSPNWKEAMDTAKLLKAAPELLAACERAAIMLEAMLWADDREPRLYPEQRAIFLENVAQLKAAIAKARGVGE